jgi:hypothetical protein
MSEDVEQLTKKFRNKCFSIQTYEVTDGSGTGHLIAYVRYVEDTTINEEMHFCKHIKKRATAREPFKITHFMKENSIK